MSFSYKFTSPWHKFSSTGDLNPAAVQSMATSLRNDSDQSHSDDGENPGPSKRIKTSKKAGAAVYRTKFNHSWTKTWPFVLEVKGDPYKFLCTVCGRRVACDHQGKPDVERHIGKAMHQANAKSLKGQSTINFQAQSSPLNEQVSI